MAVFILRILYFSSLCGYCFTNFSCNTYATLLRELDMAGLHLNIHSTVELLIEMEDAAKWNNCSLVLREQVPSSFYINPDQLSELDRLDVLHACTFDKVDIESPEHLSVRHTVYVYGQFQKSQNLIYSHLKFPLHLRYQKPKFGGGYSFAELKSPTLLVRCENFDECKHLMRSKASCYNCGQEICDWMRISYKTNLPSITVPVPVGNLDHLGFITAVTYFLTFGGCFYVSLALLTNNIS